MLYITGDLHGEAARLVRYGREYELTGDDTLIIAGDFGCIFGLGETDTAKLDRIAELPFTVLFLDGNHECFPKIYEYPVEEWNGGKVHRIRNNLLHLMRGQVFTVDGVSFFTMGGGYSIDVMFRQPGKSWWKEEMPDDTEYMEGLRNLKEHGNQVDVIISHAAPEETMAMFIQSGIFTTRFPQEQKLNIYLENVRQTVKHSHYFFGHLHMDRELFRNQTALYYNVYDMKTYRKIEPKQEV